MWVGLGLRKLQENIDFALKKRFRPLTDLYKPLVWQLCIAYIKKIGIVMQPYIGERYCGRREYFQSQKC